MGLAQGQFYFAMEYVETVDYRAILGSNPGRDQLGVACALLCQVLAGLGHAHERRICPPRHQARQPAVRPRCPTLGAKLAHFGLAKSFENAGFSGMTRDGATMGTLAYMAPEQVIDARRATPSVDIYSVGATLYSLLAGRPPHDPKQTNELILAILEQEPEPIDRINPAVPRALALLVSRALAIDPADRHRSADDLREALQSFANGVS
jgi:eukaryotic-like serine/threonine-protein kinase